MPNPDIEIVAGEFFTTAKTGGRTVAVIWPRPPSPAPYFVSDGNGPALPCETHAKATSHMLRIAMAADGGGAASVVQNAETRQEGAPDRA